MSKISIQIVLPSDKDLTRIYEFLANAFENDYVEESLPEDKQVQPPVENGDSVVENGDSVVENGVGLKQHDWAACIISRHNAWFHVLKVFLKILIQLDIFVRHVQLQ
ncbi:hypothetical protein L1887_10802 [Cichorium endivia]|nr:hypothetical protein L1887_10802 [Cichorium endivia]